MKLVDNLANGNSIGNQKKKNQVFYSHLNFSNEINASKDNNLKFFKFSDEYLIILKVYKFGFIF